MTPVERIPIKPITARMMVFVSYAIIRKYDGRGIEAVNTVDLLRSCQATYVACHGALERSLHTQGCPDIRQDP